MAEYDQPWNGCSTAKRYRALVPKICQEYQNISNNIELYRNPECPNKGLFSLELHYYLCFSFFRRFLHTVKGRAFDSPLARALYPRARTAEVDPRTNSGPRPL
jgi:hypothetical protein